MAKRQGPAGRRIAGVPPLSLRYRDGTWWTLVRDFSWRGTMVPAPFVYDGSSIPEIAWSWQPPMGKALPARTIHDYHYRTHVVSRATAAATFRDNLRALGIRDDTVQVMYQAVRAFGDARWANAHAWGTCAGRCKSTNKTEPRGRAVG